MTIIHSCNFRRAWKIHGEDGTRLNFAPFLNLFRLKANTMYYYRRKSALIPNVPMDPFRWRLSPAPFSSHIQDKAQRWKEVTTTENNKIERERRYRRCKRRMSDRWAAPQYKMFIVFHMLRNAGRRLLPQNLFFCVLFFVFCLPVLQYHWMRSGT